jgi:hypothetical protein
MREEQPAGSRCSRQQSNKPKMSPAGPAAKKSFAGPPLMFARCCRSPCISLIARTARCATRARPLAHPLPQAWAAMLQRRLQTAARLMAEGQGAALWQGFTRLQHWQGAAAAAGHPAAACSSGGGGGWGGGAGPLLLHTRWHSELTQRKPSEEQEDLVYDGPFGTAVKRVKASPPPPPLLGCPPRFPLPSTGAASASPPQPPRPSPPFLPALPPARRSCPSSAARAPWWLGPSSWAWMPPPP